MRTSLKPHEAVRGGGRLALQGQFHQASENGELSPRRSAVTCPSARPSKAPNGVLAHSIGSEGIATGVLANQVGCGVASGRVGGWWESSEVAKTGVVAYPESAGLLPTEVFASAESNGLTATYPFASAESAGLAATSVGSNPADSREAATEVFINPSDSEMAATSVGACSEPRFMTTGLELRCFGVFADFQQTSEVLKTSEVFCATSDGDSLVQGRERIDDP